MTDFLLWSFHGVDCRLHLFAVALVGFSSHAFTDCLAMSCGMTSQTSKSFSSWPAVYRWRWRNEDLMWQCVADIDRHWFRRHCGQNAAACNFGFYSCIWVQLLFIVVPAVDCDGRWVRWRCVHLLLLVHTFESCLQKCRMNRLQGLSSWDVCHIPLFTYHRFRDLGSGLQPRWWDILIKDSCNPTIPLSGWLWRIFYSDLCYLELW